MVCLDRQLRFLPILILIAILLSFVVANFDAPAKQAAFDKWVELHKKHPHLGFNWQTGGQNQSPGQLEEYKQWKELIKQHRGKYQDPGQYGPPSGDCCSFNIGPESTNITTRSIQVFNQVTLYVTGPKKAKAGLIVFPDAFGPDSGRTKLDADRMGKLGYAVVIVDSTGGDYLPRENFLDFLEAWSIRSDFTGKVANNVQQAIQYLKTVVGVKRIASYGYCYGGWVGAKQSATANPVLLGHVSFHPSWIFENMLRGENAIEILAQNVQVPQLLVSAGNDPDFVKAGGAVDRILESRPEVSGLSNVIEFPDMMHGWVNNGDLTDPDIREAVNGAWKYGCKFLQKICPV